MTSINLLVLTGQSNAALVGSPETLNSTGTLVPVETLTDTIDGATWTGTALQLACVEAGYELGLGPGGIVPVFNVGTLSDDTVTENGSAFGGTSLIPNPNDSNPSWYDFVDGNSEDGITPGTLEDSMNAYLQGIDSWLTLNGYVVNQVAAINMQNESDESNPNVVTEAGLTDWEDAVLARRADIAADFGQSASNVPMALFWVPYNDSIGGGAAQSEESGNTYGYQSGGENWLQANTYSTYGATYNLHAAEEALVGTVDNMTWAGNYGDASMAGGSDTYVNGDGHFVLDSFVGTITVQGTEDGNGDSVPSDFTAGGTQADFITRLANSIANMFQSQAQPGSQFADDGDHADMGPIAQSASFVGGNDVLITFSMDPTPGAGGFDTLGGLASLGSGWTLNNGSDPAQVDNFATSATIVDDDQIMVTFSNPVNTSDLLFYEGIGDGHITFIDYWDHILNPSENPGYTEWNGQGAAIYDSLGVPIQVSAFGLSLDGEAPAVVTSGASATSTLTTSSSGTWGSSASNGLIGSSQDFIFSAADGNTTLPGGGGLLSPELMASQGGSGIPQAILDQLPGLASLPANVGLDTQPETPPIGVSLASASIPSSAAQSLMFADPLTHSFAAAV